MTQFDWSERFAQELTQTGNSMRFVRRFADRVMYVPGIGWFVWKDVRWCRDDLNDTLEWTLAVLEELHAEILQVDEEQRGRHEAHYRDSSKIMGRQAMLRGAEADTRVKVLAEDLDVDPYLLVVRNGTLDLRTGQLRTSDPRDRCTQLADVVYDPAAKCKLWDEHIKLISRHPDGTEDPVLEAYLRRWAGYTLTGLVSEQKFFFGFGGGNNGKNVYIETLLGLLGTYAMRASTKVILGGVHEHETIIADLAGARMVFIDETPQGKVNEARIKELTGSARVRARRMRQDTFEFDARFKIWMAGNNRPRVADTTEGFWRRLDLVPFDAEIPPDRRVKDYVQVLAAERSGILNWCLEGIRDYLALGGLATPERVLLASAEYREEENEFGQFVSECFDLTAPKIWMPNNVLHTIYEMWCLENGTLRPRSMQTLRNEWRNAGFERDRTTRRIFQGNPELGPRRSVVQRGYTGPPPSVPIPVALGWQFS